MPKLKGILNSGLAFIGSSFIFPTLVGLTFVDLVFGTNQIINVDLNIA
jgi:hypothetical protein